MYNLAGPTAVASAGASVALTVLPNTGGIMLAPIAGFALIAAACAIIRLIPRKEG